ncbi:unnamed protein product [Ectocarpus sp. 12 AP-2014]
MDVDGENATGEKAAAPEANGSASPTENGGDPAAVAEAKGDEAPKKKVYTKVPLKIDSKTSAWSKSEIDRAVEIEAQMANQDRVLKETADKRNELESYVYAMRDKLVGSLRTYIEGEEADKFGSSLTAAEDWLYSDEGFDSTKSVYAAKLKELMDLGNPVESRFYEANNRQGAATELQKVIDGYMKFANSSDEAYAHIEAEEKAKARDCAKKAEKWLFQKLDQQANVPQSKNPIVTCDEINKQVVAVHATCRSIMNTPKPAPKPAEPPAAAPAKEEAKPAGGEGDAAAAAASGEKGGESAADASSAKAEGEAPAEGGGAPKSGDSMDADTTPQEAAPPADGVPPSKTTAATAEPVPETPTPMETDEVEQLE